MDLFLILLNECTSRRASGGLNTGGESIQDTQLSMNVCTRRTIASSEASVASPGNTYSNFIIGIQLIQ